jgi:hypothetical protein
LRRLTNRPPRRPVFNRRHLAIQLKSRAKSKLVISQSAGETPAVLTASPRDESVRLADKMAVLHDAFTQERVLSGKQILHESVAAFVHVPRCTGEMMIDSHPRRAAEIICNGKNFIGRFTLAE